MVELEDLVLKRFRVEKIAHKMIVTEDPVGNYKAVFASEVERALSTEDKTEVEVLIGNNWMQIRGNRVTKALPKIKHNKEYRQGYNAGYSAKQALQNPDSLKEGH